MIEQDLENFWYNILDDLFGGHKREDLVLQRGIFRYDMFPKVQGFIDTYEPMIKSVMDERGYIDGEKLTNLLNIPFIEFPKEQIRLSNIYKTIQPLVLNIRRLLL